MSRIYPDREATRERCRQLAEKYGDLRMCDLVDSRIRSKLRRRTVFDVADEEGLEIATVQHIRRYMRA